jgi:hypothetical protein
MAEKTQNQTQSNTGSFFLDQRRLRVDHDAKFRQKFEPDPALIIFSDFHSPKPEDWAWTTPTNYHHIANYTLQGVGESESAELIIKQFAKDKGGDLQTNIERWKSHFRSDGGAPVRPIVSTTNIAGFQATLIEINGEYMGLGASWHHYDYTMLISLIEYEKGNLFLRLLGPAETINAHRNAWNHLLENATHSPMD